MDFMPAVSKASAAPSNGQAAPLTAVAGAPAAPGSAATPGAPTNFMQLLAQLVGTVPAGVDIATNVELPELAADPDKKDSNETDSDDAADDAALSLLIPGLCAAPVPVVMAASPDSSKTRGVEGVTAQGSGSIAQELLPTLTSGASADAAGDADSTGLPTTLHELFGKSADATPAPGVTANMALPDASATLNKLDSTAGDAASSVSGSPNSNAQASQLHAAAAAHARANGDAPPPADLRAPVGTPAWHDELGNQLTMMAHRGLDSASLKLSPEHLGPLEIRISMREGEASVWFGANNADTRSALDQSLPKLKEMFAAQGMVLADAGVFKEAPRQQYRTPVVANSLNAAEASESASVTHVSSARLRLLDTYV